MKTGKIGQMPDPVKRAYLTLPERLRQIRREQGFTQFVVEQETGILTSSLSTYENGVKYPQFDNLIRLATFYGVSVGWLLGETNVRKTHRTD